jgi:hypothetical protein
VSRSQAGWDDENVDWTDWANIFTIHPDPGAIFAAEFQHEPRLDVGGPDAVNSFSRRACVVSICRCSFQEVEETNCFDDCCHSNDLGEELVAAGVARAVVDELNRS